jgi:phosphoserine phosphatase
MNCKALLLDFDGTLVQRDMLTEVIDLVGKKTESEAIDADFQAGKLPGTQGLIKRINLLSGVSIESIQAKVREDLALTKGAKELFQYCKKNDIVTVLASGSIVPILEIYKSELGIDHIVGPQPTIINDKIIDITEAAFPKTGNFKVIGITEALKPYGILGTQCVALGDSRGDLEMFKMAGFSIGINPKVNLDEYINVKVTDLHQVIEWLNIKRVES